MKRGFLVALLLSVFLTISFHSHASDSSVVTTSQASVTGTSAAPAALATADLTRKYLLIQNRGTASVYAKTDAAHSGTEGIEILAGGYWEPVAVPVNAVFLKAASGTQDCTIVVGK